MKQVKFINSSENVNKNEAKIFLKKCETNEIPQPPDGGWSWMVIIGTILVMITSQMVAPSFGIMFSTMLSTLKVSSTTVSWIFNTHGVMWNISKLMAGPLSDVFSWRPVAMFGAFLATFSIIISAFATSAAFLFFSFSILGGLGAGLTTSICFFIIPSYFKKYRSQAMSIMLVGSCCGQFLFPIIMSFLLDTYGFFGAVLLTGGIILHGVIGCALFRPLPSSLGETLNQKVMKLPSSAEEASLMENCPDTPLTEAGTCSENNRKLFKNICESLMEKLATFAKLIWKNIALIKSFRANIIAIGISTWFVGYLNLTMLVAFSLQNDGYSLEEAAWCTSASGMGNIVARVMILLISNWPNFNRKLGYTFGASCLICGTLGFTFASSLVGHFACMTLVGFGFGMIVSLYPLIIIDIMGMPLYTQTFGFTSLFNGFFCVTIGPLIGFVRDCSGSYLASIRTIAGTMLAAFILWLCMPIAIKYDSKKSKGNAETTA